MAATRFFLDMRGKAKDGKGSVLISLYHNSTTTTFGTGIRISPENWCDGRIVGIAGAEALNANLNAQKTKIDKKIALLSMESSFFIMTASQIKKSIAEEKPKRNHGHPVSVLFKEYVETGNLKDGTKSIYKSTLKKVISFSGESVCIEALDLRWLRNFDNYLSETQGINGKAIYLRALRAVCNYAKHTGIVSHYPFDTFSIRHEETRKRSIAVEQLRLFYHKETSLQNQMYRDYFFLMFFLIGINSKDLLLAKKSQVNNGRLEYIRAKTNKRYTVRIEPEADELIKKHYGKSDYLLDAMDHCIHYNSFMREINEAIQSIGDVVEECIPDENDLFAEPKIVRHIQPTIPDITTYYARHTWATFAHKLDISSDIIALALGHSPTNRTTFIYIKPDLKKVDEANRKVIDYFLGKSE